MNIVRHARVALPAWLGAIAVLPSAAPASAATPPPNLKIAFMGDGNDGSNARAVLQLIEDEGADAVVHAGDFDYSDPAKPANWDAMVSSILGPCFPYFAVIGNHDLPSYVNSPGNNGTYKAVFEARMNCAGIPWSGDLGSRSSHSFQGLFFVMTAPGVFGEGDGDTDWAPWVRDQLAADTSAWRISAWHVAQEAMQVGDKDDEAGWGVYEESRKGGAIVATGHEHSYSRTHAMSSFEHQVVASTSDTITLRRDRPGTIADEGRSFAFVSGLGGKSIRDQTRCLPITPPYGCNGEWASIYALQQGAKYGALFGEFNHAGDPCLARFYFKNIAGEVIDEFFVRSTMGPCAPCRADLDDDGTVGLTDLTMVMSSYGGCTGGCAGDLDDSGSIDAADVTLVVRRLGRCRSAPTTVGTITLQRP